MPKLPTTSQLAVLIDADNSSFSLIERLLEEIATLGLASIKRIYGDWTSQRLAGWKPALLEHSIQPIQQFAYTTGKNATDSALIIDAMDLLYTHPYLEGFCLVSSDSDFTRLASRLREAGKTVYGFGSRQTPKAFTAACQRFIYTDNFSSPLDKGEADLITSVCIAPAAQPPASKPATKPPKPQPPANSSQGHPNNQPANTPKPLLSTAQLRQDTHLLNLMRKAIDTACGDNESANLGSVGQYLNQLSNDFDPRTYGYAKLSGLIRAIGLFNIQMDKSHKNYTVERQHKTQRKP